MSTTEPRDGGTLSPASTVRRRESARPGPGRVDTSDPDSAPVSAAAAAAHDDLDKQGPFGKTPDGTVFKIPQTHDMLSSLFDPRTAKSDLDLLTLSLLGAQVAVFLSVPVRHSRWIFFVSFALWRTAYDLGLGYVLTRQSKTRWIVKLAKRSRWFDFGREPNSGAKWVRRELEKKMGPTYDVEAVPIEFNAWLGFRCLVDVILLNDFLSYLLFTLTYLEPFPTSATSSSHAHSLTFHALRWIGGILLLLFNLWVKVDAHRIVKDYAWYWGDAFFLSLQNLVFDGVFELAPHPMYSVGYAGYYAMSLVTWSPPVLFVSLAAHAAQFGFLHWFETPHIERVYGNGERKPLAARTPLYHSRDGLVVNDDPKTTTTTQMTKTTKTRDRQDSVAMSDSGTTGGNVTETETLIESDDDDDDDDEERPGSISTRTTKGSESKDAAAAATTESTKSSSYSSSSRRTSSSATTRDEFFPKGNKTPVSRHDLDNVYFKKDLLMFKNFDPFRTRDLLFGLLLVYALLPWVLTSTSIFSVATSSPRRVVWILSLHAVAWRGFHSVVLGLALKKQSEKNWIVRHFFKHYHYEQEGEAVRDAFENWKSLYNASLIMTYGSFLVLAWKCYRIPNDWTLGSELVRHTLGLLLIALHVWSAQSTFEVLGPFGWFYGDFFIPSYPHELYYTGIYRFLNNPERSMGGCAFFGIVLISASKVVLVQALVAVVAHWWFLSFIENPHMRRLYGNAVRKDAGVTKTLRNARRRPSSSGLHHVAALDNNDKTTSGKTRPHHVFDKVKGTISKNVKEVQGTVEKVLEETADALEEFLSKTGPAVKGYVEDTKLLLQQSGERLVISRVATDLARYDQSRYSLSVREAPSSLNLATPRASTSSAPSVRYHLGEPITVEWTAPRNHSRRDWVGIYRVDGHVQKSKLVTRVSSQGKWVGVFDDEWRGDEYNTAAAPSSDNGDDNDDDSDESCSFEKGRITFGGKKLPWRTGLYELRYHHDGKHSVMASAGPIEIFVDDKVEKAINPDEPVQAHRTLTHIIARTLALDPKAIPASARHLLVVPPPPPPPAAAVGGDSGQMATATTFKGKKDKSKAIDQDQEAQDGRRSCHEGGEGVRHAVELSDEDDFILYTSDEAEHIAYAIDEAFGVELDKEVVVAAANVGKLVNRVLEARNLLGLRVVGQGTGAESDRRDG